MSERTVRIGGGAAFWGDSELGPAQLVRRGRIDYLVLDYLAEITMALLVRARAKAPELGYARDFIDRVMAPLLGEIVAGGVRVVTNAGGINPLACRDALEALAAEQGLDLPVAVVLGDDLLGGPDALDASALAELREMETGAPLPEGLTSLNAYLGARPIAAALDAGARVVITGRCVDSALALGPLLHEFRWATDDYDRLAQGSLAGHLVECGAQATGGLFTDWERVEGYEDIGFAIAEAEAGGSFVITKAEDTGGLVTPGTVGEQLLYEIGDPRAYLLPDVTCDFTAVTLTQEERDRVRVTGARGRPPTASYKACGTWQDGWRATTTVMLGGGRAAAKARKMAQVTFDRTRAMLAERGWGDYAETSAEVIGAEDTYGARARPDPPREAMLKLAVRHPRREAVELFAREIAPAGTGLVPGLTGFYAGRPHPVPVVKVVSTLVDKARVTPRVVGRGDPPEGGTPVPAGVSGAAFDPATLPPPADEGAEFVPEPPLARVPLVALAWGRSGDKGDHANIGIMARDPAFVPLLRGALTAEVVAGAFAHYLQGDVTRYELPGIGAFNFWLTHVLGGGGTASLRLDPQGKAFAQMLLDLPVTVPRAWVRRYGWADLVLPES